MVILFPSSSQLCGKLLTWSPVDTNFFPGVIILKILLHILLSLLRKPLMFRRYLYRDVRSDKGFLPVADNTPEKDSKVPISDLVAEKKKLGASHRSPNTQWKQIFIFRNINKKIQVVIFCKDHWLRHFVMAMKVKYERICWSGRVSWIYVEDRFLIVPNRCIPTA